MDDITLKKKITRIVKNHGEIDTFNISIMLLEPIDRVNKIIGEIEEDGTIVVLQ